jgi:hypothetical protein
MAVYSSHFLILLNFVHYGTKSITHVILTGGVGSRLWPLSRKSQPKQYLDIF